MPEDLPEEGGEFERPPSFFPYEDAEETEQPIDLGEPVEVTVEGVFATEHAGQIQRFVLVTDGERKLPILIGPFEAQAITLPMEGTLPDRPLTHDLMKTMLDRMDCTLEKVVIDDLWSTTFYAKLHLRKGEEEIVIDSRPSDAIAMAVRFDAPIFVADGILEQGSI